MEKRRVVWRGFPKGWNPRNRSAGGYVYPYDLADGQLLDAMGCKVSPGGTLEVMRNQLMIHPPQEDIADNDIGVAKSLLEYRTDDNNQLLAFCKYGGAEDARLYVLDTDWDALTASSPTEWDYGHEIFSTATWAYESTSVSLEEWGIADAAQFDDVLLITQYGSGAQHTAPFRWDGTDLVEVGIAAPATAPSVAEDASPTGGDTGYPAGTYSYFYTYTDDEFESMPSPEPVTDPGGWKSKVKVASVGVAISEDSSINVTGIADHANGYDKKLYRGYSASTDAGARPDAYYYIATIADGTTSYEDGKYDAGPPIVNQRIPPYAVGETIAYDHAKPPRGTIIEIHRDRAYMAGLSGGSSSYDDYDSGSWGNVLWWSELQDPYSWPGDNQLEVGDDTDITNVVSWRDYLFITKESSCWVLEGAGESNFQLRLVSSTIGCIAQNAIAASPQGVLFAADGAWYMWNGSALTEVLPMREESAWAQWSSNTTVRTIAYHDGHFYIMQEGYLLMWEPQTNRWTYFEAEMEDQDGWQAGLRAYGFSSKQSHLMTRIQWYGLVWPTDGSTSNEHRYITVLHPTFDYDDVDSDGSSGPGIYHANVSVTLPPLIAPPGMTIRPLRIWVHGSWATTGGSLQPKLYLYDYGDAITNAWSTAPNAPQGGSVIGVPAGHDGSGTMTSNIAPLWLMRISGDLSGNFKLQAVEVEYVVMQARGG